MNLACRRNTATIIVCLTVAACAASRRPALGPAAVAHLTLADIPDAIAVTPDGEKAYVTARGKIYVVAPADGELLATIPLPTAPRALALSPDATRLFVADFAELQLTVIDTTRDTVVQRVPIGHDGVPWEAAPSVLAVSPDGTTVYVGAPGTSQLWAIDTARPETQRSTTLNVLPGGVTVSPAGTAIYVTGCPQGCLKGELAAYDPVSLQRRAALGLPVPATRTIFAPPGDRAYVLERTANNVAVVDPRGPRVVGTIATGNHTGDIALAPDGAFLYATSFGDKRVLVIDTTTRSVIAMAPVPAGPRGIAASPDGRFVLVTAGRDELIVFDAAALRRGR